MKRKKKNYGFFEKWKSIIIIAILLGAFVYIDMRPLHTRQIHRFGCLETIPTCYNDVSFEDWFYQDIPKKDAINEIDALRLFLNQERMQYVLEEVIRFKPNIRLGDDYVRSYAGCFLYTHYYNAANYESYPEETWACIFDPNEIKQFEYYEKIITYESTTIDLLNKLR